MRGYKISCGAFVEFSIRVEKATIQSSLFLHLPCQGMLRLGRGENSPPLSDQRN